MSFALQSPARGLSGGVLLAYYLAARRAGQLLYDESWVVPNGDFRNWRKGEPRHPTHTSQVTIFDRLVSLGVLERIEGSISRERSSQPLEWPQTEDVP